MSVCVGAIICPASICNIVHKAVKDAGWLKKGKNICVYEGEVKDEGFFGAELPCRLMSVHIHHQGAKVLSSSKSCEDSTTIPSELRHLFASKQIFYVDGLRIPPQDRARNRPVKKGSASQAKDQTTAGEKAQGPAAESSERFRYIELFSGLGGFRVGLDKLGGRCVFASEIDVEAQDTYERNFGERPHGDLTEIHASEIPAHDVLTAGFPCQSFSRAGSEEGLEDDRGNLFFEVIRILSFHKPKGLLLENVANLITHDDGKTFARVQEEISNLGYQVFMRLINTRALLPQQRERVYIVGIRRDLDHSISSFAWPSLPVLPRRVEQILEVDASSSASDTRKVLTIPSLTLSDHQWGKVQNSIDYKLNPGFKLVDVRGSARTLMSGYKRGYLRYSEFVRQVDANPRFYSPRECARLQGFPDSYALDEARRGNPNRIYFQLGNAVSPPIIAAVGSSLISALDKETKTESPQVRSALELVLAATPSPHDVVEGDKSLKGLIEDFLSEPASAATYSGVGQEVDDAAMTQALKSVSQGHISAQRLALHALARLTDAKCVCAAVNVLRITECKNLLAAVASLVSSKEEEIARLAAVFFANFAQSESAQTAQVKEGLAACGAKQSLSAAFKELEAQADHVRQPFSTALDAVLAVEQ